MLPFDSSDAYGPVRVEILAMDYWCNWSRAWTEVWVEDKVPVQVISDVEDLEITCKIYETARYLPEGYNQPLSIESIIDLAKEKDDVAMGALDDIFGGYLKVWKGPYGNFLDENGREVVLKNPFVDSSCYCEIEDFVQIELIADFQSAKLDNPETTFGFILQQNYPNPFLSTTTIGFILPHSMEATISLFNINGQIIQRIQGEFLSGENQISLNSDLFPGGGIYYYQLNTPDFQNTKRMVFIK